MMNTSALIGRLSTTVVLFAIGAFSFAQDHNWNNEVIARKIDEICKGWDVSDAPGGAVGVVKDGKMIFAKGYGLANVENGVPNTTSTRFDVGSVSKQFTAMCVLILEERGELSIEDPVSKYFPNMPIAKNGMTVRNLMEHTSGIRDYFGLMVLSGYSIYSDEDVMKVLNRQTTANFKPGRSFSYSNSGYFLLGELIEQLSGQSLREFAEENIFKPLGMKDSVFHDDLAQLIRGRAFGYVPSAEKGLQVGFAPLTADGAGGLVTTLEDMMKWTENWKHNKLGSQEVITRMQTKATISAGGGTEVPYALALMVDQLEGIDRVQHGGDFIGFHAQVSTFPDHDLAIYTFGNDGTQLAKSINDEIAKYLIVEKKDEDKGRKEIAVSEEDLKQYEGRYNLQNAAIVEFVIEDGKLKVEVTGQPKYEMFASAKDEFFLKVAPATIVFNRDEEGKIKDVTMAQSGQEFTMLPVEPYELSEEDAKQFPGRYYSAEMDVIITLKIKGGELWAETDKFIDSTKIDMHSEKKGSLSVFKFDFRVRKNEVTEIRVTIPRSNNIVFKRMLSSVVD